MCFTSTFLSHISGELSELELEKFIAEQQDLNINFPLCRQQIQPQQMTTRSSADQMI
jgi:hypothetical protein